MFSSLERAIQLSLDAVAGLVAFLGSPMVSDNAAAAAMTNESRQASPVPIWNERDVCESGRERNTFPSHARNSKPISN